MCEQGGRRAPVVRCVGRQVRALQMNPPVPVPPPVGEAEVQRLIPYGWCRMLPASGPPAIRFGLPTGAPSRRRRKPDFLGSRTMRLGPTGKNGGRRRAAGGSSFRTGSFAPHLGAHLSGTEQDLVMAPNTTYRLSGWTIVTADTPPAQPPPAPPCTASGPPAPQPPTATTSAPGMTRLLTSDNSAALPPASHLRYAPGNLAGLVPRLEVLPPSPPGRACPTLSLTPRLWVFSPDDTQHVRARPGRPAAPGAHGLRHGSIVRGLPIQRPIRAVSMWSVNGILINRSVDAREGFRLRSRTARPRTVRESPT